MTPDDLNGSGPGDAAEIAAALAVVDDALASERVTAHEPLERELQELALALRADSPAARPEFASELARSVERGFERPAGAARPAGWRERLRLPRPSLAVAGAAASLVLALAIGLSLFAIRPGDPAEPPMTLDAPAGQAEEGLPAPSGGGLPGQTADGPRGQKTGGAEGQSGTDGDAGVASPPITVPPPPSDGGEALGERDRRVVRSAMMTLAAPADDLDEIAGEVADVAARHRGFVLRSSVTSGDAGTGGGSFELRVPVTDLDATLAELGDIADVRSQTQTEDDVTAPFTSIEDRLEAATAQREGLLRRLERAGTDAEEEAIRRRLGRATRRADAIRAELRTIERRTAFASVSVSLVEGEEDADSTTGAALDDALDSLLGAFNLAVRVLGFLVPIAIVAGLAWLSARALRQRRRESALG